MSLYKGTDLVAGAVVMANAANQDLSNLTSIGKNIANWSNNVTNCITEIPQDIKLELNNGTLTLKSGSKVYCPNGSGVFDVITTSSDLTLNQTENGLYLIVVGSTGSYISSATVDRFSSGSSDSLSGQTYHSWYDTTNNLIKRYRSSGSTVDHYESFPIALVTVTNGAISSIDQVFNGFGYIGSTVFALPNVKGLIPNGRNADGSLKNIEFTIDTVKTATRTWVDSNFQVWGYTKNPPTGVTETWYFNAYIESDEEPSYNEYVMWYKPSENITYVNNELQSSTPNWEKVNYINFGKAGGINSQEIKIFTPKTSFQALDYNDSSTISGWSMPSNRYIDLTLGASGSTYKAPANGWFTINKHGTDGQLAAFENITAGGVTWISCLGRETECRISCPAKKGDNVRLWYNATGATIFFRFVYAEGEN